jgi:hypothetical protein
MVDERLGKLVNLLPEFVVHCLGVRVLLASAMTSQRFQAFQLAAKTCL